MFSLSGSSRLASRPTTAFTEKNEEEEQLREESASVCARVIAKRRKIEKREFESLPWQRKINEGQGVRTCEARKVRTTHFVPFASGNSRTFRLLIRFSC